MVRQERIAAGIGKPRIRLCGEGLQPVRAVCLSQKGHHPPHQLADSLIFCPILRRFQGGIIHIHTEQESLYCREGLADIIKPEWRIAQGMVMTYSVDQPGCAVTMGCRFRNEERIAPAGVLIADRFECRNIDIRAVYIDGGRAEVPDLMDLRNRAAGGIGAGGIALIQPAVDGHGQIVYRPSGGGDPFHIAGDMIGGEDFLRGRPKGLRPGAAVRSAFHRGADILRHGAGMGFHVFQKIGRNRCCKDGVRGIRNLPGSAQ